MTARTFFWQKIYVLSDLILKIECPYVARMAKLTPWFSPVGLKIGSYEKDLVTEVWNCFCCWSQVFL